MMLYLALPDTITSLHPFVNLELPCVQEMRRVQDAQPEWHDFQEMTVLGAAFAAGIPVGMWTDTDRIWTDTDCKRFNPTSDSSDGRSLCM